METKVLNFQCVEVTGASKQEAIEAAGLKFFVKGDATQKYKNWLKSRTGAVTEKDKKQFMLDYLQDKDKSAPGNGYAITLEAAVADTREHPWTVTNITHEGKREANKAFALIDEATNAELARVLTTTKTVVDEDGEKKTVKVRPTKAQAIEEAKKLIAGGLRSNILVNLTKDIEASTVAKVEYTPSKSARNGRWLVFGIAY